VREKEKPKGFSRSHALFALISKCFWSEGFISPLLPSFCLTRPKELWFECFRIKYSEHSNWHFFEKIWRKKSCEPWYLKGRDKKETKRKEKGEGIPIVIFKLKGK